MEFYDIVKKQHVYALRILAKHLGCKNSTELKKEELINFIVTNNSPKAYKYDRDRRIKYKLIEPTIFQNLIEIDLNLQKLRANLSVENPPIDALNSISHIRESINSSLDDIINSIKLTEK